MGYHKVKQSTHSRGEDKEKEVESLFKEIMAENIPKLGRDLDIQVYEAHRSPKIFNSKRSSPRHIVIEQ